MLRIAIKLTPKGGRDALEGWIEGAGGARFLKARVAAIPEDGKANKALLALLAKMLKVAKSSLRIVSGETARIKIVEIEGDAASLSAQLDHLGTV